MEKQISDFPAAMPPTAHTHTKSQISDFPSTMAPTAHMHSLTDIIFDNNNLSFKKWDNQAEIWYKGNMMLMFANYSPDNLEILNDGGTGDLGRHFLINQTLSVLGLTIHSTYVNRAFLTAKYHSICIETYENSGSLTPTKDNLLQLGISSRRWKDICAVNSTISTSDRRLKDNISYIGGNGVYSTRMDDSTLVLFMMGLLPCIYNRTDGDSNRPHHGLIAQDIEELLQNLGIKDHAAFIKSPKTEDVEVEEEIEREIQKEDGTTETVKEKIKKVIQKEIPGEYIYSLRYEEFIADIIRFCQILYSRNEALEETIQAQQEETKKLEERIAALEKITSQSA